MDSGASECVRICTRPVTTEGGGLMTSARRLSVTVAVVFSVPLIAFAQEIPNWPAPPYWSPRGRAMDSLGERSGVGVEAVEVAASTSPLPFIGVTPCRLLDTRNNLNPLGGGGPCAADEIRTYTLPGACGLPGAMQAVSLNVTATNTGSGAFGHIKIWPADQAESNVSTLNYPGAGATVANAAIVSLSAIGALKVKSGNASADVILDVNGYYAPAGVGTTNTFLGRDAGNFTMTGDLNTGFGDRVLFSNTTGYYNTATGGGALFFNITGSNNTATGIAALVFNITGGSNTATGENALFQNTTGNFNTATGAGALSSNTTGNSNTSIGSNALHDTTGFSNIGIGQDGGSNLTSGSNNICIGNSGVAGESSTIRIGDVQTATFLAGINGAGVTGIPVLVSSSGQLGVASSSRYVKENIREIAGESDGLMRLRPVTFKYKPQIDPTGLAQYGLIAEEVADVYPDLVAYDRDGRPETVRYHLVNALLLNEAQKQHRTAEAQEKTIEQQKETIDHEQAEIEGLKARLSRLEARLLADSRP